MNLVEGRKILVIDDETDIVQLLDTLLLQEGATVATAQDGRQGLRQFYQVQPDLVISDIMMPVSDGWHVCQTIREISDVPIILLTALDHEDDVVRGLESGAVDYVTKPFSPRVLLARVSAALRQSDLAGGGKGPTTYADGYLYIDLPKRQIRVADKEVQLTMTEFKLLSYLIRHAGQTLTFDMILQEVWGWEYRDSTEYVHVYISALRRKIERNSRRPEYIITERGVGYRFIAQI